MVTRTIYPSKRYDYLKPRPVRIPCIYEILVTVTPISEDGTELLYPESYPFWVNPGNTVTLEDIADLYRYQLGKEFTYTTRNESLSESGLQEEARTQASLFH